jgi:hypothetical protein
MPMRSGPCEFDISTIPLIIVVPANAGTHNHQRSWWQKVLPRCPNEIARRMDPGVRRDDMLR